MAKAQSKSATKTAKKSTAKTHARSNQRTSKKQPQQPNTFFLITMSFLAATLLIMNLIMLNV